MSRRALLIAAVALAGVAVAGDRAGSERRLKAAVAAGDGATIESSCLELIDTAAEKMAAWIDELLDTARLEAGRPLELQRQPTDLVALA